MLILSIALGQVSLGIVVKSLFPMSTNLWWYATTYAVFLLLYPYYHKALQSLGKANIKKWFAIMFGVWSITTLIPVFDYGANNLCAFVMLYAIVFYIKEFKPAILSSKKLWRKMILLGYGLGFASIIVLNIVGMKIPAAASYACYYLRGNYRVLPMLIAVSIFILATQWNLKSRAINSLAATTFGVYLIHMYPWVQQKLFGEMLNLEKWIRNPFLPLLTIGIVLGLFVVFSTLEWLRQKLFKVTFDKIDKSVITTAQKMVGKVYRGAITYINKDL